MFSRVRPFVAVPACVIAIALGGALAAYRGQEPHIAAVLSSSAKKLRQTLPVKVSDDLTLVDAYNEASAFVFVYEINSVRSGQSASAVVAELRDSAIKRHCSDHNSGILFQHNVTYQYIVKAESRQMQMPAVRFVVGSRNCEGLSL